MNHQELYRALQQLDIFEIPKYQHDFNFISASLGKLRQDLSFDEHLLYARESAFYQLLSSQDEADLDLIARVPRPAVDFGGKILVTFHYSSYRLFTSCLIAWGIRFKLVADNNFIENQGERARNSYNEIAAGFKADIPELEIINAENRSVILKCQEALKEGFALLFYADGNSGVGGMTKDNSNMVQIPFLDHHIYVRKGIATLAALVKAPITTAVLTRDLEGYSATLDIRENIAYPENRKSEADVMACNQAIFAHLEEHLRRNPGHWEGWFYYHNFIDFESGNQQSQPAQNTGSSVFNHLYYGLGVMAGNFYYILHKRTLRLVPVTQEIYENLLQVIKENQIAEQLPVYESLFNEGVLCLSGKEPAA